MEAYVNEQVNLEKQKWHEDAMKRTTQGGQMSYQVRQWLSSEHHSVFVAG